MNLSCVSESWKTPRSRAPKLPKLESFHFGNFQELTGSFQAPFWRVWKFPQGKTFFFDFFTNPSFLLCTSTFNFCWVKFLFCLSVVHTLLCVYSFYLIFLCQIKLSSIIILISSLSVFVCVCVCVCVPGVPRTWSFARPAEFQSEVDGGALAAWGSG